MSPDRKMKLFDTREELYFIDDPIDVEPLKAELAEIERRKKG